MQPFPPPRSAYLHVPFCARRCGYCNFAIVVGRDDLAGDYLRAIELELSQLETPRPVETLYFGGGTPTRLSLAELKQLCELAKRWFPLPPGHEWTVEANPADVTPELLDMLVEEGVTRVSLGGQSFRAVKLAVLERDHAPEDVARTVKLCQERGLAVAIDLIFAAPGETLAQWLDELDEAIALRPQHLSTYGLTFEKGTSFWTRRAKGELIEAEEELQRDMYLAAIDALAAADFEHYEVSNFARPGQRSRHNEAYWSGAGYFAAGPGAARHVDGVRETNHRSPTTWLKRMLGGESPVAQREELSPEERAREHLVFGLRRLEGVERTEFAAQTGFDIDALAGKEIAKYTNLGLLHADNHNVRLTRKGLLVSDAIWPDLL